MEGGETGPREGWCPVSDPYDQEFEDYIESCGDYDEALDRELSDELEGLQFGDYWGWD